MNSFLVMNNNDLRRIIWSYLSKHRCDICHNDCTIDHIKRKDMIQCFACYRNDFSKNSYYCKLMRYLRRHSEIYDDE